ncbi:Detected protein of unknown function [Hibiscus syriacus]|uniref:TPX2 C-terminal domain-containing protein n=1 Tax=Hibiscus syriacus TaxID=106335 RepID=A0A6A2YGD0_HIBSY|nr:Detected protein of unknown function [Hibiscus syriacus]
MESDYLLSEDGLEIADQNGVCLRLQVSGDEYTSGVLNNVNGNIHETFKAYLQIEMDDNGTTEQAKEGSNDYVESSGLIGSKEGEAEDKLKQSKPHKIQGKTKIEKPSDPKIVLRLCFLPLFTYNSILENLMQPSLKGKSKLKPLKKGPPNKAEGDSELSPMAADDKAHKINTLPNYGFSFKCGEWAEKRKEFDNKLEEKIHAMKVERATCRPKAEIKVFRKTLNFKATPLASFYQEPSPPKLELKKILTTRDKSPKLGRRKSSTTSDIDSNNNNFHKSGRLSLDENTFQKISAETTLSSARNEDPKASYQEKATKSEATTEGKITSTKETNEENTTSSGLTNEELSPIQQPEAVWNADSGGNRSEMD